MGDNIIRPSQKRRWGFTGTVDNIQLTDEKASDVKDILTLPEQEEARGNGGGVHVGTDGVVHDVDNVQSNHPSEDDITEEYLDGLTKAELFDLAKEHEIELDAKESDKKEVVLAELKEYYAQ